jgi:hypothetical protein
MDNMMPNNQNPFARFGIAARPRQNAMLAPATGEEDVTATTTPPMDMGNAVFAEEIRNPEIYDNPEFPTGKAPMPPMMGALRQQVPPRPPAINLPVNTQGRGMVAGTAAKAMRAGAAMGAAGKAARKLSTTNLKKRYGSQMSQQEFNRLKTNGTTYGQMADVVRASINKLLGTL